MRVPVVMCVGTIVRTPLDSIAGLNEPDAVCPFITASVSTISKVARAGSSSEIGRVLNVASRTSMFSMQIGRHVAHDVRADMDLIEGLRLHEHVVIAVLIQIIVGLVLDERLFEAVGGFVALVDLHAVGDAAHFELGHGRALAGMDVFCRQDDIKFAVFLDDVALADIAGDNRNHENLFGD